MRGFSCPNPGWCSEMSKILLLPEELASKIAAGEIIERPASVVRELIDNSIDADARNISVEVLHGGRRLIKVSDDGIGMDRDDAILCFERYATSKITREDDLFNISTLGFRGEALPSIASVSKVTLITSGVNSGIGTRIEIGAGQKKFIKDAPPAQGTILEVRDLFYNTPARRKFLKSTPTELSHIIEAVIQKAIAYHEISFSLKHNGSDIINVYATRSLKERFIQLYSEELFNEFLEIEKEVKGIRVYGFLSMPDFTRAYRGYQYIFVNRRAVRNPTVSHAIYSAYSGLIPKDRHPAFFFFLDIDPRKVDVNVHPAKREVRFEDPQEIHTLVESSIQNALSQWRVKGISYTPTREYIDFEPLTLKDRLYEDLVIRESQPAFFTPEATLAPSTYLHIGESFIAVVFNEGLTIIDRHAAHERILYEKFLKKDGIDVEDLLIPIRVELPAKEFNIIMNYKDSLHELGLHIEEFGGNNVIIRALPKELHKADMGRLLLDIASGIIEEEESGAKGISKKESLSRNIAARLACHKSIRGSKPLNSEELSRLIADLDKTEMPNRCPHGRPTKISFSADDLKKMFKRK